MSCGFEGDGIEDLGLVVALVATVLCVGAVVVLAVVVFG